MSIQDLRERLHRRIGESGTIKEFTGFETLMADLRRRVNTPTVGNVQKDAQQLLLQRFWRTQELTTFSDALKVSFGLAEQVMPHATSLLDDDSRYSRAVDEVVRIAENPRYFRRCYHGMMHSYFAYDPDGTANKRNNWENLREFLGGNASRLKTAAIDPMWVERLQSHPELFSEDPCSILGRRDLDGESAYIDELRNLLLVPSSSWFTRALYFGRLQAGCALDDDGFREIIPTLLESTDNTKAYYDAGLGMILNRYATRSDVPLHEDLRRRAVDRWGNPWLVDRGGNSMRWGHVNDQAREIVGDWLKLEFIESFFTLLAEDGLSDPRRMNFWKHYVHAIDSIRFVLGDQAHYSTNRDLSALRRKANGLTRRLADGLQSNNAFVMQLGSVTVVEFSGSGNATYFYKTERLPFDDLLPLRSTIRGANTLKSESHELKLRHQDGIHGFNSWESMFAYNLTYHFGVLSPAEQSRNRTAHQTRSNMNSSSASRGGARSSARVTQESQQTTRTLEYWLAQRFRTDLLETFCERYKLRITDKRGHGGNLWIDDAEVPSEVARVLQHWGFTYKIHRGWWRA
ncbi:MAG: EH signature domain-containing protein [Gemmatimonas sp.]